MKKNHVPTPNDNWVHNDRIVEIKIEYSIRILYNVPLISLINASFIGERKVKLCSFFLIHGMHGKRLNSRR